MSTYTNPTGSFSGTSGDDTFIFNVMPSDGVWYSGDAGAGYDRLVMQFDTTSALAFEITDPSNTGVLNVSARGIPYGGNLRIGSVENVQLQSGSGRLFHSPGRRQHHQPFRRSRRPRRNGRP